MESDTGLGKPIMFSFATAVVKDSSNLTNQISEIVDEYERGFSNTMVQPVPVTHSYRERDFDI